MPRSTSFGSKVNSEQATQFWRSFGKAAGSLSRAEELLTALLSNPGHMMAAQNAVDGGLGWKLPPIILKSGRNYVAAVQKSQEATFYQQGWNRWRENGVLMLDSESAIVDVVKGILESAPPLVGYQHTEPVLVDLNMLGFDENDRPSRASFLAEASVRGLAAPHPALFLALAASPNPDHHRSAPFVWMVTEPVPVNGRLYTLGLNGSSVFVYETNSEERMADRVLMQRVR